VANGAWENGDQYHYNLDMVYSPAGMILEKRQIADIREASGALTPMHNEYSYIYNFAQPHTVENISGTSNHTFNWDANGNMTYHGYEESATERRQCWDEENRLMGVGNGNTLAHYIYDAAGERTMKFTGQLSQVQVNKSTWLDYAIMDRSTYYINPLMVVGSKEYTKHYFIEGQRVMSKIGGGMEDALIALHRTPQAYPVDMEQKAEQITLNLADVLTCMDINAQTGYEIKMDWLDNMTQQQGPEQEQYFYHSDHLGSSAFITDAGGQAIQHLEYLPFGELFIEERTTWNTPYKFSAKELDDETGYSYFGARYYDPNISIWLSVDPLSDKYPRHTPYNYTLNNPIILIDPDGNGPIGIGYQNVTAKAIGQAALASAASVLSGPLLVGSGIALVISGNVIHGIRGGEYPQWAVPYSLNSDFSLQERSSMMGSVSWEDGKELMGAVVGVTFPPIYGESVAAEGAREVTTAVLAKVIENIPPNSSNNNSQGTSQQSGTKAASATTKSQVCDEKPTPGPSAPKQTKYSIGSFLDN